MAIKDQKYSLIDKEAVVRNIKSLSCTDTNHTLIKRVRNILAIHDCFHKEYIRRHAELIGEVAPEFISSSIDYSLDTIELTDKFFSILSSIEQFKIKIKLLEEDNELLMHEELFDGFILEYGTQLKEL